MVWDQICLQAVYINNIIEEIKDHINIIRENEEKIVFKNLSTYNIYKNLNDKDNKTEAFGDVSEEILEFIEKIEKNMDLNTENEMNNEIENSKIKNSINNQNINNKQNKKEKEIVSINWFQNQDNSCAYDSITKVFISSLKNYIDNQNITEKFVDENSHLFFNYYIDFISSIIENKENKKNLIFIICIKIL